MLAITLSILVIRSARDTALAALVSNLSSLFRAVEWLARTWTGSPRAVVLGARVLAAVQRLSSGRDVNRHVDRSDTHLLVEALVLGLLTAVPVALSAAAYLFRIAQAAVSARFSLFESNFMRLLLALALAGIYFSSPIALAHGGGLAADGCHSDRKNGGRHCHGGGAANSARTPSADLPQRLAGRYASFPNCTAARSAGAASVRRGDPGYAAHLDRDNYGIGCE